MASHDSSRLVDCASKIQISLSSTSWSYFIELSSGDRRGYLKKKTTWLYPCSMTLSATILHLFCWKCLPRELKQSFIDIESSRVLRKYIVCHCIINTSLRIYTFMLFTSYSVPIIRMSQQKLRLVRPGNVSPIFCYYMTRVTSGVVFASVTHLLQGNAMCFQKCYSVHLCYKEFYYLRHCCLSISLNKSNYSSPMSFINKGFPP